MAHLVAQGAGNQAYDGIGNDHSGKFATREHVVADRQTLIGIRIRALVDALVATAHKQQALTFEQALGHMLRKRLATGGKKHNRRLGTLGANSLDGLCDRLDLHEHALPAAVRLVIDGTMAVVRPVAQVIRLKIKRPALRARPKIDVDMTGSNISGKTERVSISMFSSLLVHIDQGRP